MSTQFSLAFTLFLLASDLTLVPIALFLATLIRRILPFGKPFFALAHAAFPVYGIAMIISAITFIGLNVYHPRQTARLTRELQRLAEATMATVLLLAGALYFSFREVSRLLIVYYAILYLIMVTGAIWEKVVFGQWLFAPAFFWEDVVSFGVIALHSLYLYGFLTGAMSPNTLIVIVLAAYAAYVVNAGQFLWKLRSARLQAEAAK